MPGGENCPPKRGTISVVGSGIKQTDFRKYVNQIKLNYQSYSRLLLDKSEMEKLGLSDLQEKYAICCCDKNIHEDFLMVYKFVTICPYILEDTYVNVLCALDEYNYRVRKNSFVGYEKVLQQLLSDICRAAGETDEESAYSKFENARSHIMSLMIGVSSGCKFYKYFESAKKIAYLLSEAIKRVDDEKLL